MRLIRELPALSIPGRTWQENGMQVIGAGSNQAEAWPPAVVEGSGIRIGFVGAAGSLGKR